MRKVWLILCLFVLSGISLFVGAHDLSISGLIDQEPLQWTILFQTRFPRTISLILAGGMLSLSGRVMQHLMQNKFVSAGTIGMSDSAQLGILVVMLFFPNHSILLRATVAFLFSYAGVLIFLSLNRLLPKSDPMILPLTGMMFGNIIGAIAMFFAYQFQIVQNLTSWLQGNFATVMKGSYELIYLTVPVFILLYFFAYQMTVAGLGEELAKNLGMNYQRFQLFIFGLVALGTSAVLLMVGSVPFLGIVVPNLVSLFYGDHLKNTMVITVISGSLFLLISDILSRILIAPYEIPVSVVVGVIGGSLFIYLLLRGRRR